MESPPTTENAPLSGPTRRHTSRATLLVDRLMRFVITTGGLGVIAAFALIVFFLVMVVVPLFKSADFSTISTVALKNPPVDPIIMRLDEDRAALTVLDRDGTVSTYQVSTGEQVTHSKITKTPIRSFVNNLGTIALGQDDGTVLLGKISFSAVPVKGEIPGGPLPLGQTRVSDGAILANSSGSTTVKILTVPEFDKPLAIGPEPASPIDLIDYFNTERLEGLLAFRADGRLFFSTVTKKENMMTGEIRREVENHELTPGTHKDRPVSILLGLNGRLAYVIYADGTLVRHNLDKLNSALPEDKIQNVIVEETKLLSKPGTTIASAQMLTGNQTLIVTDSAGGVSGWFAAPFEEGAAPAEFPDKMHMVQSHVLPPQPAAVTAIATSTRDRQFITADASGNVLLRHMTSGTTQGQLKIPVKGAITCLAVAPKTNAVAALDKSGDLSLIKINNPYSDGSLKQLFGRIQYEGYPSAQHVYQSSATDDAEVKLGMMPLIFGTLKATFYAMLFGVPIALLAAIYSSEFMAPRVRQAVKPFIELMASLPSVVLGYIGALVIAPHVGNNLVAVLFLFLAVPAGLMLFGYLWQIIPEHKSAAVPGTARFLIIIVLVSLLGLFAYAMGPTIESTFFHGNFKTWLSFDKLKLAEDQKLATANNHSNPVLEASIQSALRFKPSTPGWAILLAPLAWIGLSITYNLTLRPRVEAHVKTKPVLFAGLVELARFVIVSIAACIVAYILALAINAAGFDPRGFFIGTYVQRNSFLLGALMGFAIIPIVYTVSEDAFSRVPNSLRSASLGLGATRWQTAVRVVIPVATSGMFSAVMIGFGRAVGETMVVLMLSGRTATFSLSPFDGLSALSANIATELPEAALESTHYRVLFLCAVILFVMTLTVNTFAEMIRSRYRKRAAAM